MTRTFAIIALALAGCAAEPPPGFRDTSVPMGSVALFEQSRLEGDWAAVAGYPLGDCGGGGLRVAAGGTAAEASGCLLPVAGAVTLQPSGPGRFVAGGREFWVLWVDADYRTAVLGSPDGSFGAVLNRGGAIPADRLEAARRVLQFNGYDLGRLASG